MENRNRNTMTAKPAKTRLTRPVDENAWKLTEPEWHGENHVSFYIPTWFDPAEYIGGLEKRDPDEYVNLYLQLCTVTGYTELHMVLFGGTNETDAVVEIDDKSRETLESMLKRDWGAFLPRENVVRRTGNGGRAR